MIVACVREVIDQLNQVSLFSKENGGFNINQHTAKIEFLSVLRKHPPCQLREVISIRKAEG